MRVRVGWNRKFFGGVFGVCCKRQISFCEEKKILTTFYSFVLYYSRFERIRVLVVVAYTERDFRRRDRET